MPANVNQALPTTFPKTSLSIATLNEFKEQDITAPIDNYF